jgi:hypothetical protein
MLQRSSDLYRELLKPGSCVLDLCSSFDSHLPSRKDLPLRSVIGHGMNDAELAANPRLDRFFQLDFNNTSNSLKLKLNSFPLRDSSVSIKFPSHLSFQSHVACYHLCTIYASPVNISQI